MAINKNLKRCIGKIKLENSITQEEVAYKLDVHKSYLSDMINGRVPLTEQITNKIYELFHIKVEVESESKLPSSEEKPNEVNEPMPNIKLILCPECILKQNRIDSLELEKKYLEENNALLVELLSTYRNNSKKEIEASDSVQEWKDAK